MKFTPDFLASQSRKQLQTIAKKNGLKANASSADLIVSLLLIIVDEECAAAQDSLPDSDVIVEVFSGKAEEAPILVCENVHDCVEGGLIVGARVEFLVGDDLKFGSIGKVNKKTYRITIDETGSEIVLKHADVRIASMAIEEDKTSSSMIISEEEEEIFCSSEVPSVEEARPDVISEVLIFSADEFGSASKKRHSMGSATSTSFDSADIAVDSIQESRRISLYRPNLSGKKSKTPVKSLTPPSHMPKYTKTQRVRREAALISAKVSRISSFAPMPSIPNSSSLNKSTVERTNSTPSAVAPSPFRSTPSKSRNGVPDFQKMHQRMMNNSKPITDVVKRVSSTILVRDFKPNDSLIKNNSSIISERRRHCENDNSDGRSTRDNELFPFRCDG